jgi:hypothetical protein
MRITGYASRFTELVLEDGMSNEGDLSTDDLAQPGGESRQGQTVRPAGAPEEATAATDSGPSGGTRPMEAGYREGGVETARAPIDEDQLGSGATRSPGTGGADVALLDPAEGDRFRQRWSDVQARFVDDPQEAVRTADGLVAELMQSLAQAFSGHKGRLESQWQSGGNPDTEELRQALQRYRSFFDRLLST